MTGCFGLCCRSKSSHKIYNCGMCRSLQDVNTRKIHPGMENQEFPPHRSAAKRTTAPSPGSRDVTQDSLILDASVHVADRGQHLRVHLGWYHLWGLWRHLVVRNRMSPKPRPLWSVSTRLQFDTCEVCLSWATGGGYISLLVIFYRLLNISHTTIKSQMAPQK